MNATRQKLFFSVIALCSMVAMAEIPVYVFPRDCAKAAYETSKKFSDSVQRFTDKLGEKKATEEELQELKKAQEEFQVSLSTILFVCQKSYVLGVLEEAKGFAVQEERKNVAALVNMIQTDYSVRMQHKIDMLQANA